MQRADLAQKIASEKCLIFRGETICNGEFTKMVADMLTEDAFRAEHSLKEKLDDEKDALADKFHNRFGALNLASTGNKVPSADGDDACCSGWNPYVPENVAPIVLVMNIFMPGVGTILSSYYDPTGCNCKAVTAGILQMLTVVIFIGWIWSVWQGAAIYKKSKAYAEASAGSA
jgi:hypothetical protein